ncbi:MAG: S1 RNA-binding domain-containing protein [Nanoarchaeota archaeon]
MYNKIGYPEKEDLVVCTVERLLPSSVIVTLDEYNKIEAMIHVSEISRKWVRNLKTYMKIGKKLVCKVMQVSPNENLVTLSLRRVGMGQHRNKMSEWANENRANDILEVIAKQIGLTTKQIYDKFGDIILEEYGLLYPVLLDIARDEIDIVKKLKIEKSLAEKLIELIKKRITLPKAELSGLITMSSHEPNGLQIIKDVIKNGFDHAKKKKVDLKIIYLGAPKYQLKLVAGDFKRAEEGLSEIVETMTNYMEHHKGSFVFKRVE